MKIVVAPDSFKGNLSAVEVAEHIEKGIKMASKDIDVKKVPVADGGEGSVEALVMATGGSIEKRIVHGPLMSKIESFFGILGDKETAVVEMAAAAGLHLVPEDEKNPLETTTYGVGELISEAIEFGCKRIIIGLGGSTTNDGGMGMAQALGAKFYDNKGNILKQGGKFLDKVSKIDVSELNKKLSEVEIIAACDVKNTLYGKNGAAYVYGPQKGATEEIVDILDKGLMNYSERIKESLNKDIANIEGAGAAGGLGAGLVAFLDAKLRPGIDIVIK